MNQTFLQSLVWCPFLLGIVQTQFILDLEMKIPINRLSSY